MLWFCMSCVLIVGAGPRVGCSGTSDRYPVSTPPTGVSPLGNRAGPELPQRRRHAFEGAYRVSRGSSTSVSGRHFHARGNGNSRFLVGGGAASASSHTRKIFRWTVR